MNFFFFQPQHADSEGLWSLPTHCLSRSFSENVLNKHTFGTMALKGEEISSAKNQTLLVKVQQPLRKTPESRAPENPTSPHVWPIQNVCLTQHISTFFYPFRWSQLIDHERALSTDSREGRPFVQTTRTGSKATSDPQNRCLSHPINQQQRSSFITDPLSFSVFLLRSRPSSEL